MITKEKLAEIQQRLLIDGGKQPGDANRRSGYVDGVFDMYNESVKLLRDREEK